MSAAVIHCTSAYFEFELVFIVNDQLQRGKENCQGTRTEVTEVKSSYSFMIFKAVYPKSTTIIETALQFPYEI